MKDKNGILIEKYNGEKMWVPFGYVRSSTDRLYRKYPNPEKGYTEFLIQNVNLDKSDEDGIVCDLFQKLENGSVLTPSIYISHKQIDTFMSNETKAMLHSFDIGSK